MIPKIIHLCWFSDEPFPVEIKICLASWKRILPDYTVRRWTYDDAKAIGCDYITEALAAKKWAFAADVAIYPSRNVSPCKKLRSPEAFAHHQVYGSWRKRWWGRKVERWIKHLILSVRFALLKR